MLEAINANAVNNRCNETAFIKNIVDIYVNIYNCVNSGVPSRAFFLLVLYIMTRKQLVVIYEQLGQIKRKLYSCRLRHYDETLSGSREYN